MDTNPSEQPTATPITHPSNEPAALSQPPAAPEPSPNPQPKSKKWLMWAVPLALIATAGLLAAGYYLSKQNNDDKQANTAITPDTTEPQDSKNQEEKDDAPAEPVDTYAGWQNSADIFLGGPALTYSFKYPSNWNHVKPGEGVHCGIYVSPSTSTWTIDASMVNVCGDGKSTQSLLSAAGRSFRDTPVASAISLTVKGRDAVQVESKPQADGQQTAIHLVTVIDNVKLSNTYPDIQNGVQVMTDIGYLFVNGTFRGASADFDAFKKEYQLIVESIEVN